MGRPAHTPDELQRRQVEALAAYGVPEVEMAEMMAIDPKTLRKHYRSELKLGHTRANSKVAEALYRKATSDGPQSVTAAIFWLKARAGWRESSIHELAGSEEKPPITMIQRIIVSPRKDQDDPGRTLIEGQRVVEREMVDL